MNFVQEDQPIIELILSMGETTLDALDPTNNATFIVNGGSSGAGLGNKQKATHT